MSLSRGVLSRVLNGVLSEVLSGECAQWDGISARNEPRLSIQPIRHASISKVLQVQCSPGAALVHAAGVGNSATNMALR